MTLQASPQPSTPHVLDVHTRPGAGRSCRRCGAFMHPQRSGGPWRHIAIGRGLCMSCWRHLQGTGELADYERVSRSRDDLLDDYEVLRGEGYDWRQCAERLGMSYPSFERAMFRARKAGDQRARRIGEINYPIPRRNAA